ncbi:hypothetical protein P3X46_027292 [Hevea brasiliensis]|uniref:Major facilitator superfamily (MFS) profile domain-containing protein n=1 Tax=Hevea brasiliensis TaxID=3981 RepID=A0ABQ9L0K6_HEVBR|nr:hypothetical protein P3X46_027292 [Hevea brasiliensis]
MGVWNSHTSVGNIMGSVVASGVLEFGWAWSFEVPGICAILVGVLVLLFLVFSPEDIGFEPPGIEIEMAVEVEGADNLEKEESEKSRASWDGKFRFFGCHWIFGSLETTWSGAICFLPLLFEASGLFFFILVALVH